MQERINLFYDLGDGERCKDLINIKSELFGVCLCETRFIQLCAAGNKVADEATSLKIRPNRELFPVEERKCIHIYCTSGTGSIP